MKRNFAVSLFGSLVGFGMVFLLLGAVGIVGARGAEDRSAQSMSRASAATLDHPLTQPAAPTANGWEFTSVVTVGQNGFTNLYAASVGDSGLVVVSGERNGATGLFAVSNGTVITVATVGTVLSGTLGTINYIPLYSKIGIDPDNRVVFVASVISSSLPVPNGSNYPAFRWTNGVISHMLPSASNAQHFPSAMNSRGQWLADVFIGTSSNGTHSFQITDGAVITPVVSAAETSATTETCRDESANALAAPNANGAALYYTEVYQTAIPEPGTCNPSDRTLTWALKLVATTTITVASGQYTDLPGPNNINGTAFPNTDYQLNDNGDVVYLKDILVNAQYNDEPTNRQLILRAGLGETVLLNSLNLDSVWGLDNAKRVAFTLNASGVTSIYAGPNLTTGLVIRKGDALFGRTTTGVSLLDVSSPPATQSDQRVFAFAYYFADGTRGIAVATKTKTLPLIFIHGISGSTLRTSTPGQEEEIWLNPLASRRKLSLVDSPPANVIATDVIRTFLGTDVYEPLLNYLRTTGGYVEYDVNNDPARRTTAGCDFAAQQANQPTLFVFAYDWRVDNATHAAELSDYIGCIHQFYPGSEVNILTHSMGGLVARRYLLDYYNSAQPNHGHHVNTLITIAAPWLGAAKPLYALETGEFITDPPLASGPDVKYAAQTLAAAHQLIASRVYAQVSGVVSLAEAGWDLDSDGNPAEAYSYQSMLDVLNIRYPNTPGSTTDFFHGYTKAWGGQDDWRSDNTGVKYFHLYGLRGSADTIGQVQATNGVSCAQSTCSTTDFMQPSFTIGDGTVPHRSATRIGNGLNYNAPNALLFEFFGPNDGGDKLVEHTGLTANPLVQASVLQLLSQATSSSALLNAAPVANAPADEPVVPARYLLLNGGATVVTSDALGHSTAPLQGDVLDSVPGVTSLTIGDQVSALILPLAGEYTTTFTTTNRPLDLEMTVGTGLTRTQLIRYLDVSLPVSVTAMVHQTPIGAEALRYDADHNGSFETVVTPTVNISDTVALDITPPTVTITIDATSSITSNQVTLSAQDSGSGLNRILYSLDGTTFQLYTAPFIVQPAQTPKVYVFADDNLSNRSSRAQASTSNGHRLYLPIIRR